MYKAGLVVKKFFGSIKIKSLFSVVIRKPEWLFAVLASTFGLIMVFAMPPLTVPDELSHLLRTYQVGQGVFLGKTIDNVTGSELPLNNDLLGCTSKTTIKTCPDIYSRVDLAKKSFVGVSASAYSPITYIPQAIGLDIGKVVYPSVYIMSTLGRVFNLLAYIIMLFLAIKFTSIGKWVYFTIGLFPVAIQQAASLSGDVMTMGLCALWIVELSNLYLRRRTINKKQIIILIALAIGLALTKQTNIILVAGALFIPRRVFKDRRQKLVIVSSIVVSSILATVLWYLALRNIHFSYSYYLGDTVSQTGQLKSILHNPGTFIVALVHEYVFEGFHSNGVSPDFLITSMHSFFSNFAYKLPLLFCILGYFGLLISFLYKERREDNIEKTPLKRLAIIYTTLFFLSLVAIAGALYISWTPVGLSYIYGVQGRYLLPIVSLLIPLFVVLRRYLSVNVSGKYTIGLVLGSIASVNLIMTVILTIRYFNL